MLEKELASDLTTVSREQRVMWSRSLTPEPFHLLLANASPTNFED